MIDDADADAIDRLFEQSAPTIGPADVAERLGISLKTVYKYLKDGHIPGYKVGTAWFVITDELKRTLRAGANKRPGAGPVIVIAKEVVEGA